MTAIIITVQSTLSFHNKVSFKKITPAITATTDSKDRIKDAKAGFVYFFPIICKA